MEAGETLFQQVMGVGGIEWIVLLAIFLIFLLGSDKMPKIMRALGKALGEFEKGRMEIQRELMKLQQMQLQAETSSLEPGNPEVKPTPPPPSTATVRARWETGSFLAKMAEELGVDMEGKSEEEVWEEIRRKVLEAKAEKEQKP